MSDFTHLHVHSHYSFLDGMDSPETLVKRAKELNMDSLAITDHGYMCGTYNFQNSCKKEGIKPLLGVELYFTEDMSILSLDAKKRYELALEKAEDAGVIVNGKTQKERNEQIKDYTYNTKQFHILFLAQNQEGWENLLKLVSEASRFCTFNGRPCCDNSLLRKYNKGIIMTTACIGSLPSYLIANRKTEEAYKLLSEWKEIFQERFYLEIQPLVNKNQVLTNLEYVKWGKENNVKIVATTDVHYALKDDYEDHDTLICVGTNKYKSDENRMKYDKDFWIKTKEEMIQSFENQINKYIKHQNNSCKKYSYLEIEEENNNYFIYDLEIYREEINKALNNTVELANSIKNIKIESPKVLMPEAKSLTKNLNKEYDMIFRAYKKLYEYKKEHPEIDLAEYEKRLNTELDIIVPKGFTDYMLVYEEIISWCKEHDTATGPGRGSAAGSLLLFLLGITQGIDPIKYKLLFSRFLTKDRKDLPDIDSDFQWEKRQEVIQHLIDKYGFFNVSNIGNVTFMKIKIAIKDIGRVLQVPFSECNRINKKLDELIDGPETTFNDYDELKNLDESKYKQFKEIEDKYPELFRLARKFEGKARSMGIHASGILVSSKRVDDYVPIRFLQKNNMIVALYDGKEVEKTGNVKLDILGLKNLDIIYKTLKNIDKKELTFDYLYNKLPLNDKNVYEMISEGKTDAVFQLESNTMKNVCKLIKPDNIEDIIVINSIVRPGPLALGTHDRYAARKNGKEEITYPLRETEEIFKDTYGCICYQEQLDIWRSI